MSAVPIVKWVGGKTRLLDELVARMPKKYDTYYEPFAGGAALFFRLAPLRAVIGDTNPSLISMYHSVCHFPDAVMRRLMFHRKWHGKKHYYRIRDQFNDHALPSLLPWRAADFIYLNKTCFNGVWRVNKRGDFNVPMGRYKKPAILDATAIRTASKVLSKCDLILRASSYKSTVRGCRRGDFVYFDPPYDPVSRTANFTAYTAGDFGKDEQRELAETARELVARGCKVMLSNSDTPFVWSLYRGFDVHGVRCGRSINSNASKRGDVTEVIITGGY